MFCGVPDSISKGEGSWRRAKDLHLLVWCMQTKIYRHPWPVLRPDFFSQKPLPGSVLNFPLACTFLSCVLIIADFFAFCNMRTAQSSQENFVESAESCAKCQLFWKNLFTSQKRCAIMKMLWCPNFRAPFLFCGVGHDGRTELAARAAFVTYMAHLYTMARQLREILVKFHEKCSCLN